MTTAHLTSDELIEAVKRKINLPLYQNTFTEEDILRFANEELFISQVPSMMQYHEEFFVATLDVPIKANKNAYELPARAIGMRLRDVFWKDDQSNLFEMSRVSSGDRAFFQSNGVAGNQYIQKYYLENNNVVLAPTVGSAPTGSLNFVYFLRPNKLVRDSRAAIIESFSKTLTLSSVVAGDTVTIGDLVLTAVAGAPGANEFQVGGNDVATAGNLVNVINSSEIYSASNGTPATNIVTVFYSDLETVISSSGPTIAVQTTQGIKFDEVPSNIANGSLVDFLQTDVGHKIRRFDVRIGLSAVQGSSISFTSSDVPSGLLVGDYVCLANECIIPGIPSELHDLLAERTAARILAAQGDLQGLQASNAKIQEMETRQGTLIDNRVEGSPQKVLNRGSLLRNAKRNLPRRLY